MLKARIGEDSFLSDRWPFNFLKRHPTVLTIWLRNRNKSKKGSSSQNLATFHLNSEIEIKDEFADYETSVKTEPDDTSYSEIVFSSQSVGELKPVTKDDLNFNFCMSLFNEMSAMNEEQRRGFRTRTRQILKEIFDKV